MKIKSIIIAAVLGIVATATLSAFREASTPSVAKTSPQSVKEIKWYSIEEAQKAGEKSKRKYMVDIFTDWCGWCKVMDKKTFTSPDVAAMFTEKFYAVKLNAEQSESIIFKDKVYKFSAAKGVHSLVSEWLGLSFGYPTTVILDEKLNVIGKIEGFKDAPEFKKILTYYDQEIYKKGISVEQYAASLKK